MDRGSWHCTEDRDQDHPHGKCKKAKWLSGEALQIAVKRSEKQRRKGKISIWMQSSKEQQGETTKPSWAIKDNSETGRKYLQNTYLIQDLTVKKNFYNSSQNKKLNVKQMFLHYLKAENISEMENQKSKIERCRL